MFGQCSSAPSNAHRQMLTPPASFAWRCTQNPGGRLGGVMSDTSKRQPVPATPKRGEAAWKAAKEAVASRNERAYKSGRERRQRQSDEFASKRRAAESRKGGARKAQTVGSVSGTWWRFATAAPSDSIFCSPGAVPGRAVIAAPAAAAGQAGCRRSEIGAGRGSRRRRRWGGYRLASKGAFPSMWLGPDDGIGAGSVGGDPPHIRRTLLGHAIAGRRGGFREAVPMQPPRAL